MLLGQREDSLGGEIQTAQKKKCVVVNVVNVNVVNNIVDKVLLADLFERCQTSQRGGLSLWESI